MNRQLVIEIICSLFILLFVYAGLMKLLDVQKFTVQLGQSPLLMAFAPVVAWMVPIIELIIASMLALTKTRLFALYASFTLMIVFTAYIVAILTFSKHVPCSCGGILESLGWGEHLVFNITFVLLSAISVILVKLPSSLSLAKTNHAS